MDGLSPNAMVIIVLVSVCVTAIVITLIIALSFGRGNGKIAKANNRIAAAMEASNRTVLAQSLDTVRHDISREIGGAVEAAAADLHGRMDGYFGTSEPRHLDEGAHAAGEVTHVADVVTEIGTIPVQGSGWQQEEEPSGRLRIPGAAEAPYASAVDDPTTLMPVAGAGYHPEHTGDVLVDYSGAVGFPPPPVNLDRPAEAWDYALGAIPENLWPWDVDQQYRGTPHEGTTFHEVFCNKMETKHGVKVERNVHLYYRGVPAYVDSYNRFGPPIQQ